MNLVYATEFTPKQWQVIEPLLPPQKATGRPRSVSLMLVMQGILYVLDLLLYKRYISQPH